MKLVFFFFYKYHSNYHIYIYACQKIFIILIEYVMFIILIINHNSSNLYDAMRILFGKMFSAFNVRIMNDQKQCLNNVRKDEKRLRLLRMICLVIIIR